MSEEVELVIFRALGAAGVALPGDQVAAIAERVLEVAMSSARSEVSQAVAAEIVADRSRERAAAAAAIRAAQTEASDGIEEVRREAAQMLEAAKAQVDPALTDKTLIRRLNAADSKVIRRDAKIRELRRELRQARESQPARAELLAEVINRAQQLTDGHETAGLFNGREVVSVHKIYEFTRWLEVELQSTFDDGGSRTQTET